MSDNSEIQAIMNTLNVGPKEDDYTKDPDGADVAAGAEAKTEQPEANAVADLAAKFTDSMAQMSSNQQLVMEKLVEQMMKNTRQAEDTVASAPQSTEPASAPVYTPNPAYDLIKESDPDTYAVLIANDKALFERDQELMAIVNKQADKIDELVKINNGNLGYLENSVVSAKHSDAATITKSKEFTDWIDQQNPIVKPAYIQVLEGGTSGERIQLIDMFKEQAAINAETTQNAAKVDAAAKGTQMPAPGSLTDFESSKGDRSTTSLLDMAMDPDKVEKYLSSANGDPDQIRVLSENLALAIAAEM